MSDSPKGPAAMRFFLALLLLCSGGAFAQTSPNFVRGQTPTAAQWNSYFSAKTDSASGVLTDPTINGTVSGSGIPALLSGYALLASPTFTGTVSGSALSFTGAASLTGGGTLGGTFAGTPAFSGAVTFGSSVTTNTGSANGFLLSGTLLSVTGSGNVNATIRPAGTGSVVLQSGASPVTAVQVVDGGAGAVNFLRYQPGLTGAGGILSVLGDAAAIMKLKAGTSGGYIDASFQPFQVGAINQNLNFVLTGNPAARSTIANSTIVNISGTNGVSSSSNIAQWSLNVNDTAVINGGIAGISAAYVLNSGFDGSRFPINFTFGKTASSVTGDGSYITASIFNHPTVGEAGTGDTITASQAAGVLTVTAATGSVIGKGVGAIQTWIYGAGMTPERWVSNGTGTGGTGTYNVDKRQDISAQTMSVANFAGSYETMNPDMDCDVGPYANGCQGAEFDIRLRSGDANYKTGITVNYGLHDAYHGIVSDCSFCVTAIGVLNAGARNVYAVGNGYAAWPIDSDLTNSAMLAALATPQAGVWSGNPARYRSGYIVSAEVVECLTACWRSPGMDIDGGGQISAGPITMTYSATGTLISAGRPFASASAAVTAGGGAYNLNDRTEGPDRSIWSVSGVSGGVVSALTLIQPGYSAACPSAGSAFKLISPGSGLKATITCNTENGIVLGAASDKLGFYGATAIVKATPVGACAGSTGCQALRDALGNLGLIDTGSISD